MEKKINPDASGAARWVKEEYAAQSIGVNPKTLKRWWDEHRYGPERHRIGPDKRRVRYLKSEVDGWTPADEESA
jgi:predicted DNA-binding transcriptional regulator AlpA